MRQLMFSFVPSLFLLSFNAVAWHLPLVSFVSCCSILRIRWPCGLINALHLTGLNVAIVAVVAAVAVLDVVVVASDLLKICSKGISVIC